MASIFTYSIVRPYPNRWFTPVVFLGGVIALCLLSMVNFASTGFAQEVKYFTDPEQAASYMKKGWMGKLPSYFTSAVNATCQPTGIPINTKFFTNQSAFTYTITDIWNSTDLGNVALPAFTYFNDPIKDCSVNAINMEFEAEDRSSTQYGFNAWGVTLQAFITCSIKGGDGVTFFNATTEYDYVPPTAHLGGFNDPKYDTQLGMFKFITARNETTKASLWWGESLLSTYWSKIVSSMQDMVEDTGNLRKGTIHFTHTDSQTSLQDITSLDFWTISYRFLSNTMVGYDGGNADRGVVLTSGDNNQNKIASYYSIGNLTSRNETPNIWIPADSLAKSFYSTILVDLGQIDASPNMLTNATALQFFSQDIGELQTHHENAIPGPANDSYENLRGQAGNLTMSPSVISTRYLCQVPKRKSPGTLFISILVADLVLLQALWRILNFVTSFWVTRKDPTANFCAGCAKRVDIPLDNLSDTSYKGGAIEPEREIFSPPLKAATLGRKKYSRLESDDGVI